MASRKARGVAHGKSIRSMAPASKKGIARVMSKIIKLSKKGKSR